MASKNMLEHPPKLGEFIAFTDDDKRVFLVQGAYSSGHLGSLPNYSYSFDITTPGATQRNIRFQTSQTYKTVKRETGLKMIENRLKSGPDRTFLHNLISGPRCGNIGGDPEIFIATKTGDIVPAFDFLPMVDKTKPSWVFADGFAAELNPDPGTCLEYYSDRIHQLLQNLNEAARKAGDFQLTAQNVFDVPQDIMGRCTDEQVRLGCDPTLNVYGLIPDLQNVSRLQTVRSAGGHMHFDIRHCLNVPYFGEPTATHKMDYPDFTGPREDVNLHIQETVKALDATIGVISVSLFDGFDDPRRRLHYGLAGEYRMPRHGLEYRTLSNAWMRHPVLLHMCYEISRAAISMGMLGLTNIVMDTDEKEVIRIIQDNDVPAAREYMSRNEQVIRALIGRTGLYDGDVFKAYMAGAKTFLKDPDNILRNWRVTDANGKPHSTWQSGCSANHTCWRSSHYDIGRGVAV